MDAITNKNFIKALQYFPKWMQIRRRPYKSTGGHLLMSIVQEITDIYKEVDLYAKDFFLVNYAGKEDQIISQIYVCTIGELKDKLILDNGFKITKDLNLFYKENQYAYYENGNLYFKINEIDGTPIGYSIDSFHYTSNIKKEPVWNIFDEFAWFTGIDRLPNESNLSLSNRTYDALRTKNNKNNNILFDDDTILNVNKHRFNSTEYGLKYLIKNLLSAYAAIPFKDIHIDKLNNININDIVKNQKVYDYISELNKDIAREKVWDLTFWENQFKKMDYLPHMWDQPVDYYQQGVGYFDSLKVTTSNLINNNDSTDVNILGYKKSRQKISQFLLNSNKSVSIDINLKKFGLDLKPLDIQYNLKATSITEVNPESVLFSTYKTYNGKYIFPIEKFVDNDAPMTGITVANKGLLVNDSNSEQVYKVVAKAKNPGGNLFINSFKVDNNELLDDTYNNEYFKKESGTLSYVDNYFYGTNLKDFSSSINLYNVKNGIALDTSKATYGSVTIPITDEMKFKTINYSVIDTPINIINRFDILKLNNFKYNQQENYLYVNSEEQGSISINQIISSFNFEIDKLNNEANTGSCKVIVKNKDGNIIHQEELNTSSQNKIFNFTSSDSSKKEIIISKIGQIGFKIKYINASSNGIQFSIDGQAIQKTLDTYSIPDNSTNKLLTITLYSYLGISSPVLEYVSIAGEYTNFKYYEKEIIVPPNGRKEIKISCHDTILSLYRNNQLINDNYDTYNQYNGTGKLVLNVNKQNIRWSSYPILTGQINKRTANYINIDGTIKYIEIDFAQYEEQNESLTLKQLLVDHYNYLISKEKVYVTYDGKIIIYNNIGKINPYREINILGKFFNENFDKIKTTVPDNLLVNYIHDKNSVIKTSELENVNKVYKIILLLRNSSTHVLNKTDIIVQSQKEYPINLNEFIPQLSNSDVYILEINMPDNYNLTTQYIRYVYGTQEVLSKWCLIGNNINIVTPTVFIFANFWNNNESDYNVSINKTFETTLFSTDITLSETYEIEGKNYNLAEYILSVPSYLSIYYSNKEYTETIQLKENGIGKLKYSNIVLNNNLSVRMNNQTLSESDYKVYAEPGIIQINDPGHFGTLSVEITYTYKSPIKISFNNLDKLYELVEYSVDAYEQEKLTVLFGMKDNETRLINNVSSDVDKIYANSTNPNFTAIVVNNNVTVYRNNTENKIAVSSGYYYENGKEYYYPANTSKVEHSKENLVDLNNTKKQGNYLILNTAKKNYIPNSGMFNKILNPLCYVNFKEQKEISEISAIKSLTTANTFNNWTFENCDPTLVELNKNYVINFEFKKDGYAIFRIDKYLYNNSYIYIKKYGDLKISLYKENKINGFRLQKRPLLTKLQDFAIGDTNAIINFEKEEDFYYYIVVTGSNGSIEEIVVSDAIIEDPHKKNIDNFGWNLKEKHLDSDLFIHYDNFNAIPTNVDYSDNNDIVYGTTIDYDATLINSSDLSRCHLDKVLYRNNQLVTLKEPGTVTTEIFDLIHKQYKADKDNYSDYIKNIIYMIAKINTLSEDKFNINVLASDNYYTNFYSIGRIENNCFTILDNSKIKEFIKLEIEMPANSIINSIDVYTVFNETDFNVIPSLEEDRGNSVSRLFKISDKGNYTISEIHGKIEGDVRISIRSLRQNGINSQFTPWKEIYKNGVFKEVTFGDTDTFQIKVELLNKESVVNINKIGLKKL